ncbi:hypothetical protein WR25_24385 [Diploscapter pachys]|uniref:EGF-like domain-containing protein n=1 Tax=Diploscapter pachys TaxID=2018661 RepID=A0A2A2LRU7_9BILA|nr:hypothetical protein WR25_24385 [Diploscapter pachys]
MKNYCPKLGSEGSILLITISNWTQRVVEYARGNEEKDDGCRLFEGSFLLSATALYNSSYTAGYGVKCKCPGTDGHKYCGCLPFYQGQECNRMVCLNGGIEVTNRCQCPQYFLGYHCEIDTNRTMHQTPRFTRYPENGDLFTRDISGTAFSLIMIILLIASLYLLLKHRLQLVIVKKNCRHYQVTKMQPKVPDQDHLHFLRNLHQPRLLFKMPMPLPLLQQEVHPRQPQRLSILLSYFLLPLLLTLQIALVFLQSDEVYEFIPLQAFLYMTFFKPCFLLVAGRQHCCWLIGCKCGDMFLMKLKRA